MQLPGFFSLISEVPPYFEWSHSLNGKNKRYSKLLLESDCLSFFYEKHILYVRFQTKLKNLSHELRRKW